MLAGVTQLSGRGPSASTFLRSLVGARRLGSGGTGLQVMPAVSLASFGMWDGYLEEGNRPQHFLFVTLF